MMKRVQSDNIQPKKSSAAGLDASPGRIVERNVTAPPSPRKTPKATRSSLKNKPRIPLSLQAVFIDSQRNGEAKVPPPSNVAFFAQKWMPNMKKKLEKSVPEKLQFGLDQIRIVSPRKKVTNFTRHIQPHQINDNTSTTTVMHDDRWKDRSNTQSIAPPRVSSHELSSEQQKGLDRWTEGSEIIISIIPRRRYHRSSSSQDDYSAAVPSDENFCRWKDSYIFRSLLPPRLPQRYPDDLDGDLKGGFDIHQYRSSPCGHCNSQAHQARSFLLMETPCVK